MAARANLVLTDRAATPVAHTYTPDGDDANGVHAFSEKTGVPAGNPRFTAQLRRTKGKYRPSLRLQVPIVQTSVINGVSAPVVVRSAYIDVSMTFDELSTEQERKDAIGMMVSALAPGVTQINDMCVVLADIY